jgi:hypothetical protein
MFAAAENVVHDLKRFARHPERLVRPFNFASNEIGQLIVQYAAGRFPDAGNNNPNTEPSASRRGASVSLDEQPAVNAAALKFVREVMMATEANHFTRLGVARAFEANTLRDNYRRLMALVHPDANPEGFDPDAATRVNAAYAVLSDDEQREAYVSREFSNLLVHQRPRRAPSATRATAQVPLTWREKLSEQLARLQTRSALLLFSALLALPVLYLVARGVFSSPPPPQVVEARPRLSMTREVPAPSPSSGEVTAGTASSPSTGAPSSINPSAADTSTASTFSTASTALAAPAATTPPSPTIPTPIATTTRVPAVAPVTTAVGNTNDSPTSLRLDRALRSEMLRNPPDDAKQRALTSPPASRASTSDAVSPSSTARSPNTDSSTAGATSSTASTPSASTTAVAAIPPAQSPVAAAAIAQPTTSADAVKTSEAEDLILRFAAAYTNGRLDVITQYLSPSMNTRRRILTDYDRIFQATTQRDIKFGQLKHATTGDRVTTSGYATVTTIDHSNRSATQRVYLEFEIGKERGEPRIERLANYVIH